MSKKIQRAGGATKRSGPSASEKKAMGRPGYIRDVHLVYRWARAPEWLDTQKPVASSRDAWPYFRPLEKRVREATMVLYLNTATIPLGREIVHVGTIKDCPVNAAEILRSALHIGASAVILGHNHPSMDCRPSLADKGIFEDMKKTAALLNIQVLDFLIIAPGTYYSLKDAEVLDQCRKSYEENAGHRAAARKAAATRAARRAAKSVGVTGDSP